MFGIGPTELIVILVIALIVVGPEKLPQLAGQVGKAIRDFRQMSGDVTGEFQRAFQLDEPPAEQRPFLVTDTTTTNTNGTAEYTQELATQVIPSEPPIELPPPAEELAEASSAAEAAPVTTDYSTLASPPLATKAEPLAGVSMLDEPEPPPTSTAYESQDVASLAPRHISVAEATGMTAIADAWSAVETTDATISLPEPPAEELQPVLAATAVAVAESEEGQQATAEIPVPAAEEPEQRPRIDPTAEVTIREVIESQVAAEAFRERRRIATYRRNK